MNINEWENCYPSNWKGIITPEAMAHPAKYSSKLIRRIYEHMIEMGWLKPGDKVLDPFGGVGLGAFDALRLGLHWTGNELEEKFHTLGNQNIDLWNARYGHLPRWGSARLLHGDSRKLMEILPGLVEVSVSSPPYGEEMSTGRAGNADQTIPSIGKGGAIPPRVYGTTPGQLGEMKSDGFDAAISSPPFLQSEGGAHVPSNYANDPTFMKRHAAGNKSSHAYGKTEGQLSSMEDGGFDAAVSSPPYNPPMSQDHNGSRGGKRGTTPSEPGAFVKYGNAEGQLEGMNMDGFQAALSSPPYAEARIGQESGQEHCGKGDQYGQADGQLGSMKSEGFDAAISSPPYDTTQVEKNSKSIDRTKQYEVYKRSGGGQSFEQFCKTQDAHSQGYGDSEGQLSGAGDFWFAARAIVEQVYQALEPGGHAVWVVKDYVKNKQIVPFCDQWRQLCEAVGFETLHEHRAMLVHRKGAQHTLDGGLIEHKTESKSFFRRLAEKKGSPRIDWETVYCMEKPKQ